jgi:cyclic pyranopterin phosphate synthase
MPEQDYVWLPREHLLQFEEIETLVDIFLDSGVDKIRLTGGEPLLRRDVAILVKGLASRPRVRDLAMTTNGVLLAENAEALRAAGLHRLTVSLDTLRHDRFRDLARFDELDRVKEGIRVASTLFGGLKIDSVVIRGVNDDELADLIEFGRTHRSEVRFIEYMDVGGATQWSMDRVVSKRDILDSLGRRYGAIETLPEEPSAPARRYRLHDGTVFGIIASTTEPFCSDCDRSRVTADGMLYLCLYATEGADLRRLLRSGNSAGEIASIIAEGWRRRRDRGAEDRLTSGSRSPLIPLDRLRRDPHLEMHTRGG